MFFLLYDATKSEGGLLLATKATELDISTVANGVYLMRIADGQNTEIQKGSEDIDLLALFA